MKPVLNVPSDDVFFLAVHFEAATRGWPRVLPKATSTAVLDDLYGSLEAAVGQKTAEVSSDAMRSAASVVAKARATPTAIKALAAGYAG